MDHSARHRSCSGGACIFGTERTESPHTILASNAHYEDIMHSLFLFPACLVRFVLLRHRALKHADPLHWFYMPMSERIFSFGR
jgi:hypothetical protein